jgi:hypothetical protein
MANELTISGKVYYVKPFKSITVFKLGFYAGKDMQGKAKYGYIKAKAFSSYSGPQIVDGIKLTCHGWLTQDQWKSQTDGIEKQELVFCVKEAEATEERSEAAPW